MLCPLCRDGPCSDSSAPADTTEGWVRGGKTRRGEGEVPTQPNQTKPDPIRNRDPFGRGTHGQGMARHGITVKTGKGVAVRRGGASQHIWCVHTL